MTPPERATLRVEQVLRLLPEVDALVPLRALLVSTSRPHGVSAVQHTVGARMVRSSSLPRLVPAVLEQVTAHLSVLYAAAIEALDAESRGDTAGSVRAFVRAGDREYAMGRDAAARRWLQHALGVAERGRARTAEVEVLQRLADLETASGDDERAARLHGRALSLAESEGDAGRAALAALALGAVALRFEDTTAATAWYERAEPHTAHDPALRGRLALGHVALALTRRAPDEATDWLTLAAQEFAQVSPREGRLELLLMRGRIASHRGAHVLALADLREAVASLQGDGVDIRAMLAVRLAIGQCYLDADRLPDAEDEVRAVEELAIVHDRARTLPRVYLLLGAVRARQRDETGFVFFEKAIELCRGSDPAPRLEAQAYFAYSRFRSDLGDVDEARACLERAREILEFVRDRALAAQVDAAIGALPSLAVAGRATI